MPQRLNSRRLTSGIQRALGRALGNGTRNLPQQTVRRAAAPDPAGDDALAQRINRLKRDRLID